MNLKNFFKKIRSYGFWVSLSSALILLLTSLGNAFGFEIENKIVEDVVMAIAGLLVVLGIVSMNGKKQTENGEVEKGSCEDEIENIVDDDNNNKE